jgi:hypothetical protein
VLAWLRFDTPDARSHGREHHHDHAHDVNIHGATTARFF